MVLTLFFGFSLVSDYKFWGGRMHVKLFCFLVMLPSLISSLPQRTQLDNKVRGNSFGLENFLFQTFDNAEIQQTTESFKPKRVRPAPNARLPNGDRSQSYGLENLGPQVYESNKVKPTPAKIIQNYPKRRPFDPTAESYKINENLVVRPQTIIEVTEEPEVSTQEVVTERIRKRITMRRRRKRPSNSAQSEGNGEILINAIPTPVRIPIYPVAVKASQGFVNKPQPTNVKYLVPLDTEEIDAEEVTEKKEPIKPVTEKSTTTTTEASTTPHASSTINLKDFLKQQTETLSLSELLQTQNLSLADLLRGNKDASAILKARQRTPTTAATIAGLKRKQISRTETEPLKKADFIEATTARVSYNGFQPKIPRTKPSEQIGVKPTVENQNEFPKSTTTTTKRPPHASGPSASDTQNRLNELRLKLRNFQKKTSPQPEVTSPPTARDETIEPVSASSKATTETPLYKKNRVSFKSTNNPELSLIIPSKAENIKRPERIGNWTSRLPSIKRIGQDRLKINEVTSKPTKVSVVSVSENNDKQDEPEPKTTIKPEEVTEEVYEEPESKDALLELLKSGKNAERLQKILNSRNMTIQELLDNREKPPLQTDISSLFSSPPKEISTSTTSTYFDSLPDFGFEETDSVGSYDEPEAEESAPNVARIELSPSREPKQYEFPVSEKNVVQLNLQPDDLTADTSNAEDSALWKLSEKSIYYGNSYGYGNFPVTPQTEQPKESKPTRLTEEDIILVETIRKQQETNQKFKFDFNNFVREEEEPQTEDIEKSYIPPAVKSAIIASGVVMGIALFVFIAIFAACGWKQRQIRLKGSSSTLGGTLTRKDKSKRALSPVSFKDSHSYKKTLDFDDETSESGSSNTSSYLWSTLKNTFTSRASTLKSRLEKEEKMREDKVTLRRNESRRKESRLDDRPITDEMYTIKKIDRDRSVINTSFNFKRSTSNNNLNHFNECVHGY